MCACDFSSPRRICHTKLNHHKNLLNGMNRQLQNLLCINLCIVWLSTYRYLWNGDWEGESAGEGEMEEWLSKWVRVWAIFGCDWIGCHVQYRLNRWHRNISSANHRIFEAFQIVTRLEMAPEYGLVSVWVRSIALDRHVSVDAFSFKAHLSCAATHFHCWAMPLWCACVCVCASEWMYVNVIDMRKEYMFYLDYCVP